MIKSKTLDFIKWIPLYALLYYRAERGKNIIAAMAESADALDSGSSEGYFVEVQVLLAAPNQLNPNRSPIFTIGEAFGFILYLS